MNGVMHVAASASVVAEIQGLYGPFSFPEKLLQKIWLRGDFARDAMMTSDGRRVHVLHPGKWNLLGGPDFTAARLRLGDEEITGDVELHLRADDWAAHAHARDRAYDGVVLHVVLFPPERDHVTRGSAGQMIPVVALLPLLDHDLEEFAAEEAVEALAGRAATARLPDELAALESAELKLLLQSNAQERWRLKVHFARLRLRRLGWEAACHHAGLEILGYRFNRAPMLRVAERRPLADWGRRAVNVEQTIAAEPITWNLQGVRPANHPRVRLRQYSAWTAAKPDWPSQLLELATRLPEIGLEDATGKIRRVHGFAARREDFAELTGGAVGGTRLDNLVCDGFLPLLAAHGNHEPELAGMWFHWFPGDLPPLFVRELRRLDVFAGRVSPAGHGFAQGLLGWLLKHDVPQ